MANEIPVKDRAAGAPGLERPPLARLPAAAVLIVFVPVFVLATAARFILLWAVAPVCLFLARRSIAPSLTMHVVNNLFAYILLPTLLR